MGELLSIGLGSYAALCLVMFAAQRKFFYLPDRTRPLPEAYGAPDMEVRMLTAEDGVDVLAWYRAPANDDAPVIAYFHGNAGHIGDRVFKMRPFMDQGFGVLLLSYRGYGGSAGAPSEQGFYADARAALAFLDAQGVRSGRLVIYGESMGSGVAVQMATEHAPAALVLEAPFTSLTAVAFQRCPYLPVPLIIRDRFDSIAKIAGVEAPLLVVHGERDRTVTVGHGRRLLATATEPKEGLFIPEAGHADLYDFGVGPRVLDFIRRKVPAAETAPQPA